MTQKNKDVAEVYSNALFVHDTDSSRDSVERCDTHDTDQTHFTAQTQCWVQPISDGFIIRIMGIKMN